MEAPTTEAARQGIPLLVGKRIDHTFDNNTYIGTVISVVPGFPNWYNVHYDDDPAVYAYNLAEDYRKGDLKIRVNDTDTQ